MSYFTGSVLVDNHTLEKLKVKLGLMVISIVLDKNRYHWNVVGVVFKLIITKSSS